MLANRVRKLTEVYLLKEDGTKWLVPNDNVLASHGYHTRNIHEITPDQLHRVPNGFRLTYAPGSVVRFGTSEDIYMVESGGVARHVPDEVVAIHLFGGDWRERWYVVEETLASDYHVGDPLPTPVLE